MQRLKTDRILFFTVIFMTLFGALMVYSASGVTAESRFGSSWHFAIRQGAWLAFAIPSMFFFKNLYYRKLQTPQVAFTAMALVTVLLVIVYFADPKQHRWIRFPLGGLQPSELAKPALVIFLACFIALRSRALNSHYTLLPAILGVGALTFGVMVADLGTAIVLLLTAAIVFLVAGLEMRWIVLAIGVVVLAFVGAMWHRPYRLARVVRFVDPEFKIVGKFDRKGWIRSQISKSATTEDTNYQIEQSKIAIGSGGPLGVGLMQGRQKLFYLPEAHTDMIYAVIGEEWGLIGTLGVLAGFVVILWRGMRTTLRINDEFGRYLALGITTVLSLQAFFNITVALGVLPAKGFPLPTISFGGSSLLVTLSSLGILMNVSEHAG